MTEDDLQVEPGAELDLTSPPFLDAMCFDRDGEPVSWMLGSWLRMDDSYSRVASTLIGSYWVSTVWLLIDHGHGRSKKPIIFETMVFKDGDLDGQPDMAGELTRRYSTFEDALTGHGETITLLLSTVEDLHKSTLTPDQIINNR